MGDKGSLFLLAMWQRACLRAGASSAEIDLGREEEGAGEVNGEEEGHTLTQTQTQTHTHTHTHTYSHTHRQVRTPSHQRVDIIQALGSSHP